MYDIFFIVYDVKSIKDKIRARFPLAKFCIIDDNKTIKDAVFDAQVRSMTKMFWIIDIGHEIKKTFDVDYQISEWNQSYVHVFKEEKSGNFESVYLIPKSYHITKNEAEHLFFINKKEIDIIASYKKDPDIFFAVYNEKKLKDRLKNQISTAKFCIVDENNTIQEALYEAQNRSSTKIFWFVDIGYNVKENFNINYEVPEWDQKYVHVFKEETTNTYNGMYLIPKLYHITQKEADHLFFINKKEIATISSKVFDYEVFVVTTYEDYLRSKKESITDMFYLVFSDLTLIDDFKFDHVIDKSMQHLNYVFKNGNFYDGVILTSKNTIITEKEFNNRFLINRSEIDLQASVPEQYEIVTCNSYDDYLEKRKTIDSSMFYLITDNLIIEDFKFDYQVPKWNQDKVHIFKNGNYYDGILLLPKDKLVTQREFNYRFFINKMEIDINASKSKPFDIVFISYSEPNADENYQNLLKRFPHAKRIHGVKGIHQAHKKAARLVDTAMFWVVDGDAQILDNFKFDYQVPSWNYDVVHVFRSQNPINGLQYGYGGVKLLPTISTRNLDISSVDMTTSISSKFKPISIISNVSKFNTNEFDTWKSAFRECVKLSSCIISGQNDKESLYRLDIWCSEGEKEEYGKFAIAGAKMGKDFGFKYKDDSVMLSKINDWEWLKNEFQRYVSSLC